MGEEQYPKISVDKVENWNRVAANCKTEALRIVDSQLQGLGAERELVRQHMEEVRVSSPSAPHFAGSPSRIVH